MNNEKKLHPFFSYFGSKYRLTRYYSEPEYNKIVEPFAGSAGYALNYPCNQVYLYEVYEPIVELWDYLINVSEKEILELPIGPFDKEHPVETEVKMIPARTLLGFWLTQSQTSASRYPQSKSRGSGWTERKKQMIADQLKYIRHWKIEKLSYDKIPNQRATWFVDPPYEQAGHRYRNNGIDYSYLSRWCKERCGQVIVCEQNSASWLKFQHLKTQRNASNKDYRELIWEKS
jgi:site-specific DNA-adenine methylase